MEHKIDKLIKDLNSYKGDNIWEDVIHQHDNPHGSFIDWEATEREDPYCIYGDTVVLIDKNVVQYDTLKKSWVIKR